MKDRARKPELFAEFFDEARRLVNVLDQRLVDREFICDAYSIADIACYPWFEALQERCLEALERANEVQRWMKRLRARPAVDRGMHVERPKRAA